MIRDIEENCEDVIYKAQNCLNLSSEQFMSICNNDLIENVADGVQDSIIIKQRELHDDFSDGEDLDSLSSNEADDDDAASDIQNKMTNLQTAF